MVHERQRTILEELARRPDPEADVHEQVVLCLEAERLRRELNRLPALERWVLRARFGIGCRSHSRRQIAAKLQITLADARWLEEDALTQLRGSYTTDAEAA